MGLRAVVSQARGSDCWSSTDSGLRLARGTEALGRGGSGGGSNAGHWWLGSAGCPRKAQGTEALGSGGSGRNVMGME